MTEGADNVRNNLLGWELLRSIQEESSDWPGVETSCRKSLAILSSDRTPTIPSGEDPKAYETKIKLTQARALVHMGHKNHLKQAVNMLQEVSEMHMEQHAKVNLSSPYISGRGPISLES